MNNYKEIDRPGGGCQYQCLNSDKVENNGHAETFITKFRVNFSTTLFLWQFRKNAA